MVELLQLFRRGGTIEELQSEVHHRMKTDPVFRERFITGPNAGRIYFLDIFQSLGKEHL